MPKLDYDTTLARMAGNILSGREPKNRESHMDENHLTPDDVRAVWFAVALARAIVAEVKRTTPYQLAPLSANTKNIEHSHSSSRRQSARSIEP